MAIRSDIRFRFATTEVECVMSNDNTKAQELVFDVTLPKDAFISNFSMYVGCQFGVILIVFITSDDLISISVLMGGVPLLLLVVVVVWW